MGLFDNIATRFGYISGKQFQQQVEEAVKREIEKVPSWAMDVANAQRWEIPDIAIWASQADMYRLSPVLGTALDVLMDDVGLSKFNVKRLVGEDVREIPNHPFGVLMRAPNPLDSGLELMRDTVAGYKLNGNAVWWLNRKNWNDEPTEIWTVPFEMMEPVPDGRMYLSHYNLHPGGGQEPIKIPLWQVVHFKTYNPHNRFVGLSPIESLAETLVGDLGMRKTRTRTYTQYGGEPKSILAFKDWVANEAWEDVKKEKARAALENEMMMLRGVGDGVSWIARSMSSRDAEFIANLRQGMMDVFNRMAPGLLAMLDPNATEANAMAARATYSEKALWKTLEAFAQKITSNVLPAYGRKLFGEFDDPRVVDRKLEMEEQRLYAEVHTLAEVRMEYYQEEPLGDERDKLLVAQIRADSGGVQKPEEPKPQQTPPAETMVVTEDVENDAEKAAIDALYKWRKQMAGGKMDKAKAFVNSAIPKRMEQAIKARLNMVTEPNQMLEFMDRQIESLKPKPRENPYDILKGLELAVKAIEAKGQ